MFRAMGILFMLPLIAPATIFGAEPGKPNQIGRMQLRFTERSPLSAPEELSRRLDFDRHGAITAVNDPKNSDYNLANESFDVFVPANYNPTAPHGAIVWMGVCDFSPAWLDVLARHKLIYISATKATGGGNGRLGLHLDAVQNIRKLYNIDEKRIYISGFSAGAGMSAQMICGYPDVFRGGLFMNSGTFYLGIKEPTVTPFTGTWKGPLDTIKKETRLVLMWGERDPQYTAQECKSQFDALTLDGFERAAMFIVPGEGHAPPTALWFEKGIIALDQTKPRKPPTTSPTTQPHPEPGQIAQAKRILATAKMELDSRDTEAKKYPASAARAEARAKQYLRQVIDEYPTAPAAATAREMLMKLDQSTTQP